MTEKKSSIKDDFTTLSIILILIGITANVIGGKLAYILHLPMYLDTIGTIFASIVAGPWIGAITGLLSNVVNGIMDPIYFWFIPVNIITGLITGFLSRAGWFTKWEKGLLATFIQAVASSIASTILAVLVFNGIIDSGTSIISEAMIRTGHNIWTAVGMVELIWTIIDRIISWLISLGICNVIPNRTLLKFPLGHLYLSGQNNKENNQG
ncbi:MAG: ECF transporter S component [Erysipelotrichaceae bacterium]|nr:ECF transporter S component [Erysipelotrichaceae bacterium]